ncbi:MAG: VOC family protein [Synechococcales bacterium]|nr:VOC family protein [Synechococcales bacterium]
MMQTIFHVAFPIADLEQAKQFYVQGLGCQLGRENRHSLILNLGGHQLVGHLATELTPQAGIYPRHFGLILTTEADWQTLCDRAQAHQLKFREAPKRRFSGTDLEHVTFFLEDPFYNLLEFKYYLHSEVIFGARDYHQIGDRPE